MSKAYIWLRLMIASTAWGCLAVVVALFRGNAMTPNLTTWRNQQWRELHEWAVNPTAEENTNLKYCLPTFPLLVSGALVRIFSGDLRVIAACGLVTWAICIGLMRRYVQAKTAIGAEVEFGSRGFLIWWAISFAAVYAFLVFFTGALLSS